MGMGKTLPILSAVLNTSEEARYSQFLPRQDGSGASNVFTRATLIVVPSARRSIIVPDELILTFYRVD